eukprot:3728103-Pleurochrysis_carterae.AAC.2
MDARVNEPGRPICKSMLVKLYHCKSPSSWLSVDCNTHHPVSLKQQVFISLAAPGAAATGRQLRGERGWHAGANASR